MGLSIVALAVPVVVRAQSNNTNANANANASATANASANGNATGTSDANPSLTAVSSVRQATGYGYTDRSGAPQGLQVRSGPRVTHHSTVPTVGGPIATMPGFEMLGEAGSRLFVELTQAVQVEERHAHGILTYVLKGAHVTIHNNQNPLVTVHFNTPVTRARLVPAGHDLLFIIDLRSDVTPAWKINPGKEGSSVLTVDFPKGAYVSGSTSATQ